MELLWHPSDRISPSGLDLEKELARHSMDLAPTPYYKFTQNARMPRREPKLCQKPSSGVERILWGKNAGHDLESRRHLYPSHPYCNKALHRSHFSGISLAYF
jgi:hypothetical protein